MSSEASWDDLIELGIERALIRGTDIEDIEQEFEQSLDRLEDVRAFREGRGGSK